MNTYNISLRVRLDHTPAEEQAVAIARAWAAPANTTLAMTSASLDEPRIGIAGVVIDDDLDAVAALEQSAHRLVAELASAGFTVTEWDALEVHSPAETERRLQAATIPPMVSALEFAELCGFRGRQRIYDLEHERQKAATQGEQHAFPAPVVPGYWLRSVAEHYAATRKRKPGPAPSRPNPLHANRRAAGQLDEG